MVTNFEDVEVGRCLDFVGVKAMDSRDGHSKATFFPLEPGRHLRPGGISKRKWFWEFIYYPNPTVRFKLVYFNFFL